MSNGSIADQQFYDDTCPFDNAVMSKVARTCDLYFREYRDILKRTFAQKKDIKVLELGAGTCCLSLLLSNFSFVHEIHCIDISLKKMRELFPLSCKQIIAQPEKLRFLQGDIGERLSFEDQSFDLVVADAALHHSRSIWNTLNECRRLLKASGILICQREAYLGLLSFGPKLDKLLVSEEVRRGVSENAFLKKQYEYFLRACGFEVRFLPVAENLLQRILMPLNGWVFSKWVIWATKSATLSRAILSNR